MKFNIFKNFFNLNFKDASKEAKYNESKSGHQSIVVQMMIIYGLSYFVVFFILNPFRKHDDASNLIIYNVLFICANIASFFVARYWSKNLQLVLSFLLLINMLVLLESFHARKNIWNEWIYLLIGVYFESLIFTILLGRIAWKLTSILLVLITVALNLRYFDQSTLQQMNYMQTGCSIVHLIMVSSMSFLIERFDRQRFLLISNYEESMKYFKHLLKDVLPSSLMIIHKKEILFCNSEMHKLLGNGSAQISFQNTNQIKIEEKNDELFARLSPDRNTSTTLYELILKFDKFEGSRIEESFFVHQGIISGDNRENDLVYLDVKIGHIIWESQKAIMVIISENQMIQKYHYLNHLALSKDRLLASVSHDLRTPLNGVLGIIENSIPLIEDKTLKKSLQIALRSSKMLLFVINDLLDFTQMENGTLRLDFSLFHLKSVIKDVLQLIKFQAKNKGLKMIYEEHEDLKDRDIFVYNDPNRLRQILLNLLANSLKYTEKGYIKLKLSSNNANKDLCPLLVEENESLIKKEKPQFKIEIIDSGCGIKQDDIPKLFKFFGKLQISPVQPNDLGKGLGLAISQKLVGFLNNQEKGGEIRVNSEIGKGSCFSFVLNSQAWDQESNNEIPDEKLNDDCSAFYHDKSLTSKHSYVEIHDSMYYSNRLYTDNFSELRVLVVDDDQINIMVATTYLKNLGVTLCDLAFNGDIAIKKVREKRLQGIFYDLITMDCNMPVMDGFEATRQICEMVKEGLIPTVPIIATTANASHKDYEACFQAGMTDFIAKPFSQEQLKAAIVKAHKKSRLDRSTNIHTQV